MEEESVIPTMAPLAKRVAPYVIAVVVGGAGVGYAVHEHSSAQDLAAQNEQVTAQLNTTNSQLRVLTEEVNNLASRSEAARPSRPSQPVVVAAKPHAATSIHTHVPDSRLTKLQSQVDAQGKAIDDTKADLVNTRTELTGSIARTHDELVVLEKKGERNYYEFDLQKSKQYQREGPLGVSLRKANTKRQYADLQLMVDDRNVQQKHVNLYQPVMYYVPDSTQPVEVVINDITKDHIHGYVSAPKYKQSELTASNVGDTAAQGTAQASNTSAPPAPRQKLPVPQ